MEEENATKSGRSDDAPAAENAAMTKPDIRAVVEEVEGMIDLVK